MIDFRTCAKYRGFAAAALRYLCGRDGDSPVSEVRTERTGANGGQTHVGLKH